MEIANPGWRVNTFFHPARDVIPAILKPMMNALLDSRLEKRSKKTDRPVIKNAAAVLGAAGQIGPAPEGKRFENKWFAGCPAVGGGRNLFAVGILFPYIPDMPMAQVRTSSLILIAAALASSSVQGEQKGPARRLLIADDSVKRLAIVSPDGSLEWELPIGAIHDAQLLPNGNILTQLGWQRVVEVNRGKEIVWEYDSGRMNGNEGRKVEVHAVQRLPDGLTLIAESGPSRLIEVDREGTIRREIKLKVDHPDAHSETRLARKLANGNYLVAQERDGFVREYDRDSRLVWEFEVPLFGRERKGGHGPEAFGNAVFSAERLPNGNTLIGTGNGHSVLEVTPQKKIVWKVEQNDLKGITLAWVTRVERLPNGNTLIGNCHAGPDSPQFIEVTPDKKVVWTFCDFKNFGNSTPVQIVLGQR